ncbi:MAG: hypothetical protein Q8Q09_28460 [Deltaproteobacteria bacterium]|nr:hypothetical protein [Deltaproteobacteria bacterium]
MSGVFVSVDVEPCPCEPEGLSLRFMQARADQGESRITAVWFEDDLGREGWWTLQSLGDLSGTRVTEGALCLRVQDSSAGTATLIRGGAFGLRLSMQTEHEPCELTVGYLLLGEHCKTRDEGA